MKIIAVGASALMDGFALLGIKTYADESAEIIDAMLRELDRNHETALVFIQRDPDNFRIPMVQQLRNQGGRILICEIPALQDVHGHQPEVEKLIARVMGSTVMEHQLDE
jgi:vacuolar-type H+-ATPase subunit F/Vma7